MRNANCEKRARVGRTEDVKYSRYMPVILAGHSLVMTMDFFFGQNRKRPNIIVKTKMEFDETLSTAKEKHDTQCMLEKIETIYARTSLMSFPTVI